MKYPPAGFTPYEMSLQIGSTRARFEAAADDLLSWRIPVRTGVIIDGVEEGAPDVYRGMGSYREAVPNTVRFTPEGWSYANSGATVTQHRVINKRVFPLPLRVMYVTEEQNRVAMGLGTLGGHPLQGEQTQSLELRSDDTVWFTIRGFVRPTDRRARRLGRLFMPLYKRHLNRMLKALHPAAE